MGWTFRTVDFLRQEGVFFLRSNSRAKGKNLNQAGQLAMENTGLLGTVTEETHRMRNREDKQNWRLRNKYIFFKNYNIFRREHSKHDPQHTQQLTQWTDKGRVRERGLYSPGIRCAVWEQTRQAANRAQVSVINRLPRDTEGKRDRQDNQDIFTTLSLIFTQDSIAIKEYST